MARFTCERRTVVRGINGAQITTKIADNHQGIERTHGTNVFRVRTGNSRKCGDFPGRLDRCRVEPYRYRTLRGNCLWSQCARSRE